MNDVVVRLDFKMNFLAHRQTVFLAKMPISLHRQRTAVAVSQPAADCRDIHARFDARGGKKMSEIMMRVVRKPKFAASCFQTFSRA